MLSAQRRPLSTAMVQVPRAAECTPPPWIRFDRRFAGRPAFKPLIPSNIGAGAHVDDGTIADTRAAGGSCAPSGEEVHLSGGIRIGAGSGRGTLLRD